MSDSVRAVAILLSVLLWSPAAPGLLRGEVPAEKALLLYCGALVLAFGGCALLSGLVRAYAPEPDEPEPDEPEEAPAVGAPAGDAATAGRRADDRASSPSGT